MCDPLTIGSIALSGAGMLANNAAQGKITKARNGALEAERIRQAGFRKETDALNATSQDRYANFQDKEAEKANTLGKYFTDANTGIPSGQAADGTPTETMPAANSNIVVQEQAKQKAKAQAFGNQQGEAMGKLRSFGDVLGDISRLQARDSSQIGTIGGFARGSSSVLPYELEAANNKGQGMANLGMVLSGLGQVGTMAGLSGAGEGLFGTTAATVTPSASVYTPGSIVSRNLPKIGAFS